MLTFYLSLIDDHKNDSKFENLYLTYNQKLYNVAISILNEHYDAEEAVQDAFIKIAKVIDVIDDSDPIILKSFLFQIIKNTSIDLKRQKQKNNRIVNIDFCESLPSDDSVEDRIEMEEEGNTIKKAILSMPETYREVLKLNLLYEFSASEIAKLLNISVNTVFSRIHRGKRYLRLFLEEKASEHKE